MYSYPLQNYHTFVCMFVCFGCSHVCLFVCVCVFSENIFYKRNFLFYVYFPKVYFQKAYFPKMYFLNAYFSQRRDLKMWRCRSKSILWSWTSNPICTLIYFWCHFSTWPTTHKIFSSNRKHVFVKISHADCLFQDFAGRSMAPHERKNKNFAIAQGFSGVVFLHRCEIWKPRPPEFTPSAMQFLILKIQVKSSKHLKRVVFNKIPNLDFDDVPNVDLDVMPNG